MDSSPATSLTNLLLFNNTIQPELMRSVHAYDNGMKFEREFVFSENSSYVEMKATPILTSLKNFRVPEISEGFQNGVWLCIFAFHSDRQPQFSNIPSVLLVTRNPKLQTIPNLHNDLHMIYKLDQKAVKKDLLQDSQREELQGNSNDHQPTQKVLPVLSQDLNCLPYEYEEDVSDFEVQDNEMNDESLPGSVEKKKRAPSDHIAKITLPDLAKYFDMPIVEASKNLNVGLTVLKRKCREFGIRRWPHRKLKSLDNLIHDLQEEAKYQESKDKAAAMAVIERKRMLESEKENIEKKPFMDIQTETKRFRQDVFKRRHKAKASQKHSSAVSST
ncbi:hypothetical protein RIF29_37402 [Crotalaria pallida]|uniref:RWP-RK domain-containing protein n=1 Tax=Crotalaria pallida TaxID=3830 RepID=A0AAN9ED79_CROPI